MASRSKANEASAASADRRPSAADCSAAMRDRRASSTESTAAFADIRPSRWVRRLIHNAAAPSPNAAHAGASPQFHDVTQSRALPQFMPGHYWRGSSRVPLMSAAASPLDLLRIVDQHLRVREPGPTQELHQVLVTVGEPEDLSVGSNAPPSGRRRAVNNHWSGWHISRAQRCAAHSTPSAESGRQWVQALIPSARATRACSRVMARWRFPAAWQPPMWTSMGRAPTPTLSSTTQSGVAGRLSSRCRCSLSRCSAAAIASSIRTTHSACQVRRVRSRGRSPGSSSDTRSNLRPPLVEPAGRRQVSCANKPWAHVGDPRQSKASVAWVTEARGRLYRNAATDHQKAWSRLTRQVKWAQGAVL